MSIVPSVFQRPGFKRAVFYLLILTLTAVATVLFGNLLHRAGVGAEYHALTVLFGLLFWGIAAGAVHAIFGFGCRLRPPVAVREKSREDPAPERGKTVVVLPIFNEDPSRVFAGLEAIYRSLARTDEAADFDFFVLSDSNQPTCWIREEVTWARLCRELNAFGRIHYRRRKINQDKKAGNIQEFCENWGGRYRYMVTLDADSVMTGETLVELRRRMEIDPRLGILQTSPRIIFAQTLWGRLQQFSNHFLGPLFVAGLDFWQQDDGSYWGHNAIIRMDAFLAHCALPDLPGREPFGGKILSHDFVEAALMRRAGYHVRLATDLTGSYEECPPDIIEHAKRDRRWCQGNMQHIWLLFSRELPRISRIHLANGIMGYASSLLWAMFLILGGIYAFNRTRSDLSVLPIPFLHGWGELSLSAHALLTFGFTFACIFLPKVLALIDAALHPRRAAGFGGVGRSAASLLIETVFSVFSAPILMIYHSRFVLATAFGRGVTWTTQRRNADVGQSFAFSLRAHGGQALIGLTAAILAGRVDDRLFYWSLPLTAALVLAPVYSWLVSRQDAGQFLAELGLLSTPEERQLPVELSETIARTTAMKNDTLLVTGSELQGVIVDPYCNAIRAALAERDSEVDSSAAHAAGQHALVAGIDALEARELGLLLGDSAALEETHRIAWLTDPADLHPSWRPSFQRYGLEAI
ncbi:glucans biosynthesis glucosyltransferase MdoH [Synoicihabitans lomoniglobus]|uniref:Glucans biosynthesis glucosyltransferase H n=1 Tax=Synoicihabitans lomoniglobus TaxID=2909285 RepID=A0AAF0I7F3_9BACT|nr:glucans biosynthesis glucosyltransferase MdoH [Opitutaceae bacterium LMO-M01]WED66706.1 glucans biosynthesis glucosyltransferase MdoH [Opitutaceae bacterium LMO-M01]